MFVAIIRYTNSYKEELSHTITADLEEGRKQSVEKFLSSLSVNKIHTVEIAYADVDNYVTLKQQWVEVDKVTSTPIQKIVPPSYEL